MIKEFDLIVIGSGPAGEKAAVKAAYFGYRVALVEKEEKFGGAGVQTGTLPSKTLKETALYLSGVYHKGIFSIDRELGRSAGVDDFMYRKNIVTRQAGDMVERNLCKHQVEIFHGTARFLDQHRVRIEGPKEETITGHHILIATGSYPVHPKGIPFDKVRVHDSDSILTINRFPKSLCVLGAGVIGCEYATIFAAMGVKTFIVNNSDRILSFLDHEIAQALVAQMSKNGITILFNNSITGFEIPRDDSQPLNLMLRSGEVLQVDMFLFAAGRNGNIKDLNCEKAGVVTGDRETVCVNEKFQTNIPHIYAAGDVIGFPALASTSMDQGRLAVAYMFDTGDLEKLAQVLPYGIYTVPEVSMAGLSEHQAKQQNLPYVTGYCFYRDTMRGKIIGDQDNGFLKLIVEKESRIIRGVHIIGSMATELIHFGLLLVKDNKTLDDVISMVFNFPTLHDLYKYASYDALGSLTGKKIKTAGEIIQRTMSQDLG
jgi:NAD(P) transhydrogenase